MTPAQNPRSGNVRRYCWAFKRRFGLRVWTAGHSSGVSELYRATSASAVPHSGAEPFSGTAMRGGLGGDILFLFSSRLFSSLLDRSRLRKSRVLGVDKSP